MTKDADILSPEVMTHIVKNMQRELVVIKRGIWLIMCGTWVLAIKLILQSLGVSV